MPIVQGLTGALPTLRPDAPPSTYSFQPIGGGLQAVVCAGTGKLPPD
ncbi:MAG TPA: hypothetical protein VHG51_08170 [Longimicrobiaceae bacterium]|nr:hypothetical protein [Longimicrobiaceae bacterium]